MVVVWCGDHDRSFSGESESLPQSPTLTRVLVRKYARKQFNPSLESVHEDSKREKLEYVPQRCEKYVQESTAVHYVVYIKFRPKTTYREKLFFG